MALTVPGDGIVLNGTNPSTLGYANIVPGSVVVRAVSPEGDGAQGARYGNVTAQRTYVEGTDYTVNYAAGTITRTAGSAIPNCPFAPSASGYYGASIGPFIVWASYQTTDSSYQTFAPASALTRLAGRLSAAQSIKLLVIGDSTATDPAGETQSMDQAWWRRMVTRWRTYGSTVYYVNRAVGGATSASGPSQFADVSLSATSATDYYNQWTYTFPAGAWDVVAVGFGMNDITGGAASVSAYQANISATVAAIRASCPSADVILMPTAWGNPVANGNFTQANARLYRDALNAVAVAYSNVYVANHLPTWESYQPRLGRALLNNDINHPTNTGHWIYSLPLTRLEPATTGGHGSNESAGRGAASAVAPRATLTLHPNAYWSQAGGALTVNPPGAGIEAQATATLFSPNGGPVLFDGTHAARFTASLDGVTWASKITAPAGTSTIRLAITPEVGDTLISARVGIA